VSKIVISAYLACAFKARVSLNVQGLRFFRRKGSSTDGLQLRGSRSKFEKIREQNQNWPNLEGIQHISITRDEKKYIYIYIYRKEHRKALGVSKLTQTQ
jgi:hypothetical protein